MCKKRFFHYFIIIIYGALLLCVLNGKGNLFGSRVDWLSQHTVFPDMFRQTFYETGKLLPEFLFDIGGGQNIFHFTYYGLFSPMILLSYILPFVNMTTYIAGVSVVSYLCAGCLLYTFLEKHFQKESALWAGILFLTLPPMTFHYHHHVMFVWYMPFLILGFIGIDRYFTKEKIGLFVISVFCMILTNYMFSVAGLVFLFVYAVFWILEKEHFSWKVFLKIIFDTIIFFLIPIGMSGFLLLPTAYALFSNDRSGGNAIAFQDMIVPALQEYFYVPYSMGISAVMLVVVVGNLTYTKKNRAELFLTVTSILMLLCPIILYVLNGTLYIRGKALIAYSVLFLYQFCLFVERSQQKEIPIKNVCLISVTGIMVLIVLRWENAIVGGLLLLELCILYVFRNFKKIWYIAPILVSLLASTISNWSSEIYVTQAYDDEMYTEEIAELMEYTEGKFYRTNIAYRELDTANRIYGENFHGTSIYSSTYNSLYHEFYDKFMGNNETYRNKFMTTGARNEYFYQFMGTKYIIGREDPGMQYNLAKEGEHLDLYENKNAFPIVYKSQNVISETLFSNLEFPYCIDVLMSHTVIEDKAVPSEEIYQHEVVNSTFEKQDVPESYTFAKKKDENYTISLDERYRNKMIYLTFDIKTEGKYQNEQDICISINGIKNKLTETDALYYNGNTTFTYVIPMENKTKLQIQISKGKYNIQNLRMYTAKQFYKSYEEIEDLQIDEAVSKITCQVMAEEGEYLVTSFPYDKGFSAYVNGEKAEIVLVNKAFVGVLLQKGKNIVELQYHAPFYQQGIWISGVGIILWVIKFIRNRRCTNENISCSTML